MIFAVFHILSYLSVRCCLTVFVAFDLFGLPLPITDRHQSIVRCLRHRRRCRSRSTCVMLWNYLINTGISTIPIDESRSTEVEKKTKINKRNRVLSNRDVSCCWSMRKYSIEHEYRVNIDNNWWQNRMRKKCVTFTQELRTWDDAETTNTANRFWLKHLSRISSCFNTVRVI
jgi:hypothetical protein